MRGVCSWIRRRKARRPRYLHFRSSKGFLLWTCFFSIFSDIFLYGVIIPVVPFALTDRIGVDKNDAQQWTSILLTVYSAALLAGSPICGWWADKAKTRQGPFLFGLVLLAASTVLLALATTIPLLLTARILQGLSGSLVWTVSLAMITDRVGSKALGMAVGWVSVGRSVGTVIAPLIGGAIYSSAGYYAVFASAFAFLGADIVFRLFMIEAREARRWDPSIGANPELTSLVEEQATATTPATTAQGDQHIRDRDVMGHGRLRRVCHRLPPFITLLGSIRLIVALWGCVLQAIIFGVFDAVLPLFVHRTFNWDSHGAGLIFLALSVPTFVSPVIGWLSDKHGPRWYVTAGYILTMVPLILLRIIKDNTLQDKIVFALLLALCSALSMLFEIPVQIDIILAVEERMRADPTHYGTSGAYAQAFGLSNLMFALGLIVGPLWGGFLNDSAGWATTTLSLGVITGATAIPAVIWTGGAICSGMEWRMLPSTAGE